VRFSALIPLTVSFFFAIFVNLAICYYCWWLVVRLWRWRQRLAATSRYLDLLTDQAIAATAARQRLTGGGLRRSTIAYRQRSHNYRQNYDRVSGSLKLIAFLRGYYRR
jgi:hypothetical protein